MIQWYYFVLISSVLMGIATVVEKRALYHEFASAFSSDFAVLAAVMSLVLIPLAKFNITLVQLGGIYILSLFSTSGYLLTARAYRHGNVSVASAAFSSLPVLFTVVAAFFLLGEKLTVIQYASITVMIVVAYLMLFTKPKHGKPTFKKSKYKYVVLAVAVINAAGAILLRYLVSSTSAVNPFALLILLQIFVAINFTAYMQIRYGGMREMFKNFSRNKKTLLSQAALTVSYRATYYFAVSLVAISLAAPLRNTIYVVITVLAGGFIFKETNIARKLIFAIILVAAAYFLVA